MVATDDRGLNADRGASEWRRSVLLAVFFAIAWLACSSIPAMAQSGGGPPPLSADTGNIHLSSPGALFDLSSRFLRVLGNEATWRSTGAPSVNNPGGGGADMQTGAPAAPAQVSQPYRAWFEGYRLRSRMDPQGEFRGDRRETRGGIAGLGVTTAPGVSFGFSVDQGRTKIETAPLSQRATVDLTQIGGNAAFESGPWTFGIAVIHGFGEVNSSRGLGGAAAVTSYEARLWGVLIELSYLWSSGNWRLVPKLGLDWTRTETDSFTETGGATPVNGSGQISRRMRILAGAEVGHTWLANQTMFDLAAYGRVVDIFMLDIDPLQVTSVTGATAPRLIAGVSESRFGVDAGTSASLRLSQNARLYAVYDGRFRSNFESHGGTLGLELRW